MLIFVGVGRRTHRKPKKVAMLSFTMSTAGTRLYFFKPIIRGEGVLGGVGHRGFPVRGVRARPVPGTESPRAPCAGYRALAGPRAPGAG